MSSDGPSLIAVAVVEHEGRYLIGLRPPGVPLAGYWEFPGGKQHADETAEQAAERECHEETGLTVTVVGEYARVQHDYEHGRLHLRFFACQLVDPATTAAPERFRWVSAAELPTYRFPPANSALLGRLLGAGE